MKFGKNSPITSLLILFIVLSVVSSMAGLQFIRLAAANFLPPPPELPYICIRADGTVEPQTTLIRRLGDTYTFNGSLTNHTLAIQRDNIVVDGAGYTLQGNGTGRGIFLNGATNVTVKNLVLRNLRIGIYINQSSGDTITQNNLTNTEIGIYSVSSSNNDVDGNNISGNSWGMLFQEYSSHNNVAGNRVSENGGGIWLDFSNNHTSDYNSIIRNCIVSNGVAGMRIDSSSNCLIEGNNITKSECGIELSGSACKYNKLVGNSITNCSNYAIAMSADCHQNTIVENTIANNQIGIYTFGSNNNEFYHNDLIKNTVQINNGYVVDGNTTLGVSTNIWSHDSEGNFWSDYAGKDANHDGVGDTPYVIDAANVDHYPLMTPYNGPLQPQLSQNLLSMPEEFINYTIVAVDGTLWAKIDGTYPMHLSAQTGTLPMVYPTPPGTTNIHMTLDGTELSWSNYSDIDPIARHHTEIGDWTMIYCVFTPAADDFVLRINYEHPVQIINGSYTFLYDLNISPYLSPWCTNSTAYFSIRMETDYEDLRIYTTGSEPWTPINHTIMQEGTAKILSVKIFSQYQKSLLGDLAVTFTEAKPVFLGSRLPVELGYAVVTLIVVAIAATPFLIYFRKIKKTHVKVEKVVPKAVTLKRVRLSFSFAVNVIVRYAG